MNEQSMDLQVTSAVCAFKQLRLSLPPTVAPGNFVFELENEVMTYPNRKAHWYSVAILVLAIDQAAKSFISLTTPLGWILEVTPFFNLVNVLNPGAAFSFLAGAGGWQRWFFLAIALGASMWLD